MSENLRVRVLRVAGPGYAGTYQTYQVQCESRMSVLDVLTRIQISQDSTLAFRYSCRAGMCGSCSMRVNGKNSWTCRIPAERFLKTGLTLEPLPNFPVIRDLAVDMKPFFDHYRRVIPQFVPKNPRREEFANIRPHSLERSEIDQHIECITCGNCFGSCSFTGTSSKYLGPAALNRAFVAGRDSRDSAEEQRMEILDSYEGLWGCHTQYNCTEACPMGISPTRAIQKLKRRRLTHAFRSLF
ncbi:MAG: succinate dehydrogenase iron-sulfur subunit [SAR324 cluster bacterium]|nr:succinate dehydrogenase iron-sulfur subunit [SAR324 cluster bacterium]